MTHKRRNILIRCLVSMLALLAIAVPVAQAEPGGLFDGAAAEAQTKPLPCQPNCSFPEAQQQGFDPLASAMTPEVEAAIVKLRERAALKANSDALERIYTATPTPAPDAVDRYVGNAPTAPLLGYGPVSVPGFESSTVPPATDLQPFSTDGPRVGIAPVTEPEAEPTGGFDWRDAAIGFSVAAVLALLAAGAVTILRNRDRVATGMS